MVVVISITIGLGSVSLWSPGTLQVSLNAFLSAGRGTVVEVFLFLSFREMCHCNAPGHFLVSSF
jgi:hypothetical protein